MLRLNVNASAVSRHAAMLERIGKQALPNAIRSTLNTVALNTKQVTMPEETQETFEQRTPNFYKANSRAYLARGVDVNSMRSVVGWVPKSGDNSHAVEDLEQQEEGGLISNRAFIPLKAARVGGAWNKIVRSQNRMGKIKNEIFNSASKNLHGVKNNKEAFIISAKYAGVNGLVLGNKEYASGSRLLWWIRSMKRVKTITIRRTKNKTKYRKGQNTVVKATPIYSVKKGRKVRVKATHFMERASILAANDMNKIFIAQAERELNKRIR